MPSLAAMSSSDAFSKPRSRNAAAPALSTARRFSSRTETMSSCLRCHGESARLAICFPDVTESIDMLLDSNIHLFLGLQSRFRGAAAMMDDRASPWMTEELGILRDQARRFLARELVPHRE